MNQAFPKAFFGHLGLLSLLDKPSFFRTDYLQEVS